MEITLNKTGMRARFDGRIVSREDVQNPKPAPDVYLHAASLVRAAPHRCVVIEDSATGAQAAKAAGMYCFGFAADTAPEKLAPVCDAVFAHMDELPDLLRLPVTTA